MTVVNRNNARLAKDSCYQPSHPTRWRQMHRIDEVGGSVNAILDALHAAPFQKKVFCEGDSWVDKFTPLFESGTNLIDAIRLPGYVAVVDVSHIGDITDDMVKYPQSTQTKAILNIESFDAIIFSGGGNDLKNLFAELYQKKSEGTSLFETNETQFFANIAKNIATFVSYRDHSRDPNTRAAPIFLHGYDYVQPRPAKAAILGGALKVAGPWIYPSMHKAGLSDLEMLNKAKAVVDQLNQCIADHIAPLDNVYFIDQRGLLELAAPGSNGVSGDWMDEIHPTAQGFTTLAERRWNVALADALGLPVPAGDLA